MAKAEEQSPIRPVDFSQLLGRLEVGTGEAARVCRVSQRELVDWTNKGFVQCGRKGDQRTYGYAALEKVCLIRQVRYKRISLERAVEAAELFLNRQAQERVALEALPVEELKRRVAARAARVQQLALHIRRRLHSHRVLGGIISGGTSEDLGALIGFLESNPYSVQTARQLGIRLGRPVEAVTKELDLLAGRHFLQKIPYQGGDVYRYIPPRRTQ